MLLSLYVLFLGRFSDTSGERRKRIADTEWLFLKPFQYALSCDCDCSCWHTTCSVFQQERVLSASWGFVCILELVLWNLSHYWSTTESVAFYLTSLMTLKVTNGLEVFIFWIIMHSYICRKNVITINGKLEINCQLLYIVFLFSSFTERGVCLPTVSLWILFVYIEAAIRFKDLKHFHVDLCRPFAAHW